eukprot:5981883-Pleurochrysis_carterae.AAC.1
MVSYAILTLPRGWDIHFRRLSQTKIGVHTASSSARTAPKRHAVPMTLALHAAMSSLIFFKVRILFASCGDAQERMAAVPLWSRAQDIRSTLFWAISIDAR